MHACEIFVTKNPQPQQKTRVLKFLPWNWFVAFSPPGPKSWFRRLIDRYSYVPDQISNVISFYWNSSARLWLVLTILYFRNKFSEMENFDIKFLLVQNTFSKNNLNPKNELFGSSEMLGQIQAFKTSRANSCTSDIVVCLENSKWVKYFTIKSISIPLNF